MEEKPDERVYLSRSWKDSAGEKPMAFDFAEDAAAFLVILPLLLLSVRIFGLGASAYFGIAVAPSDFFVLTLCRRKAKKLWLFALTLVLITICAAAGAIMLKSYAAALSTVFAAVYCARKLNLDLKRREINYEHENRVTAHVFMGSSAAVLGAITCYTATLVSVGLGYYALLPAFAADFAAVFAFTLIYRQISGAWCLAQWNRITENRNLSAKAAAGSRGGGAMFAVCAAVGVAILALAAYLLASALGAERFDAGMIDFFRNAHGAPLSPPTRSSSSANNPGLGRLLNAAAKKPPSALAVTLGRILQAACYVFIAIIAVFIAVALVRAVRGLMRKLRSDINEERHSLLTLYSAAEDVMARARGIRRGFSGLVIGGNRARIRRLFLWHVRRHGNGAFIKKSDAPSEIGEKVAAKAGGDLNAAALIYEKARYGEGECDAGDVGRMKDALK